MSKRDTQSVFDELDLLLGKQLALLQEERDQLVANAARIDELNQTIADVVAERAALQQRRPPKV